MMSFNREHAQRCLHRLELRYRTTQNALAAACAVYASLRQTPTATDRQLHQALLRIQRASGHLIEVQQSIDLLDDGEEECRYY